MIGVLGAHAAAHIGNKTAGCTPLVKGLLCALILLPVVVAWCLVL